MTETANTSPPDVVAYYRRACVCSLMAGVQGGAEGPLHPNEACPFNRITDLDYAWYTVSRAGTPRAEGGKGVSWYCSCQDGDEDQVSCTHVRVLLGGRGLNFIEHAGVERAREIAGWNDRLVILTPYGDGILRPLWAQDALRESDARSGRGVSGATGPTGPQGPTGVMGFTSISGPMPSAAGPSFTFNGPVPSGPGKASQAPIADGSEEEEEP